MVDDDDDDRDDEEPLVYIVGKCMYMKIDFVTCPEDTGLCPSIHPVVFLITLIINKPHLPADRYSKFIVSSSSIATVWTLKWTSRCPKIHQRRLATL